MKIFDNPLTWTVIMFFVSICFMVIQENKTKQIELQLKIEMVKAGITNIPTIK